MYPPTVLRDLLVRVLDPAPRAVTVPGTVPAAVLLPVLVATPEPRLVFTRRSDSLSRHAGEISFPGGLADPGEDLADAALREAREELGLTRADVELLGALPSVHTRVSGVLIHPFVGLLWVDPTFTPNAAEIAEVLEFGLADLAARAAVAEFVHRGRAFTTDVFDMDGHVIWGATGRILRGFLDALDRAGSPASNREA
jgi:8-oxo-dGTP pyrophosphatase MutT (NUDIX family)